MEKLDENLMTTAYHILVLLKAYGVPKISALELMEKLDKITTMEEVEDLAHELTKNEPDLYPEMERFITKNTIDEKRSVDKWTDIAFGRN
jgi:hypothetical protein